MRRTGEQGRRPQCDRRSAIGYRGPAGAAERVAAADASYGVVSSGLSDNPIGSAAVYKSSASSGERLSLRSRNASRSWCPSGPGSPGSAIGSTAGADGAGSDGPERYAGATSSVTSARAARRGVGRGGAAGAARSYSSTGTSGTADAARRSLPKPGAPESGCAAACSIAGDSGRATSASGSGSTASMGGNASGGRVVRRLRGAAGRVSASPSAFLSGAAKASAVAYRSSGANARAKENVSSSASRFAPGTSGSVTIPSSPAPVTGWPLSSSKAIAASAKMSPAREIGRPVARSGAL